MPLLRPDIQKVLRETGLATAEGGSISEKLDAHALSVDEILDGLSDVVHGADTSAVKLRALETASKLHGILKEQAAPPPSITIVINDPASAGQVNPILIPRQLHTINKLNEKESIN